LSAVPIFASVTFLTVALASSMIA
jgi:hypothetical protein